MKACLFFCLVLVAGPMRGQSVEDGKSLGDLYYLSYRFAQAAEAYRKVGAPDAKACIERAERAERMLMRCEDVQLIDSVVVDKASLLAAYRLGEGCGRLTEGDGCVVYENALGDRRYASEATGRGRRLYEEFRSPTGWEDRREMVIGSDSTGDDDYPFVMPDGLTVYFASNGRLSMGGYDLFVTRYNLDSRTWLAPTRLAMPFNSVANDYLMVVDDENGVGYFATDRFQPDGKVVVYTFIPNETFVPLATENESLRIRRAQVVSIRDSWRTGTDYGALLDRIREGADGSKGEGTQGFAFVIDDQRVYHSLDDFGSDAAKHLFLRWREIQASIEASEKRLDMLRLEYARADAQGRAGRAADVLLEERRLEEAWAQGEVCERNIRNAEIRNIQAQLNKN